jgi:tetratricopeptide (TPR) repeat protein
LRLPRQGPPTGSQLVSRFTTLRGDCKISNPRIFGAPNREKNEVKNTLLALLATSIVTGSFLRAQQASGPVEGELQRAHQLAAANQFEKANEILSDLVRRNPVDEAALVELGRVQLAQGLNEDAMKSFEAVLTLKPRSAPAREGEVAAAAAAALANRKADLQGDALLDLVRARKFVPDSPDLLFDFGVQAEGMQIFHDADEALAKAHELAPDNPKILYALSHVQFDEQKMPDAENNMRAYLKVRPDDPTAHFGLGRLLHMLARNDEAKAELQKSIDFEPRQSESYYELGEIALEENRSDDARNYYGRVLTAAPHHGGALTGMGELAVRKKDYLTAQQYLQEAVRYAPDYSTAHYYYALVLARLGRKSEAERESDLANKLNEEQSRTRKGNFLTVIP